MSEFQSSVETSEASSACSVPGYAAPEVCPVEDHEAHTMPLVSPLAEIDIAGAQLLQHLRLLAELGAGELIDNHRTMTQIGKLRGEGIAGDTIGRRLGLIVGKAEMPHLIRRRRAGERHCEDGQNPNNDAAAIHDISPRLNIPRKTRGVDWCLRL